MEKKPLYTIGHGNRTAEAFIDLLKQYNIEYLLDVRSQPYSAFNPQFNRERLERSAGEQNIKYVYMGDLLGGRPKDPSCYTDGKVDYRIVGTKDFFRKGIARLKTAYEKDVNVAIMCSETKPQDCHRTRLIGAALSSEKIILRHIDENGKLKGQEEVASSVRKKHPWPGLFDI